MDELGECGCSAIGTWMLDPYASEIAGIDEWLYLCDDCYQALCWEI